jgi:hypothetical protein
MERIPPGNFPCVLPGAWAPIASSDRARVETFSGGLSAALASSPTSVHGTVINAKTHEPIAKALVYTPDNRYATLTDDRGHFEFKFPPPEKSSPPPPTSGSDTEGMRKYQQWYQRNARPGVFLARRPGFLPDPNGTRVPQTGGDRAEIVITLEPEALIVGHVQLPGVDNTDRVQLQLKDPETHREYFRRDQSDFDGTFSVGFIVPGTYTIVAVEDAWGFEWLKPGVLSRCAQHGQELTIGPLMQGAVHLPDPVEVQPK